MGNTLGERVRKLRATRGLDQDELADQIGLNKGYLSKIETGKIQRPSYEVVAALAKALRVSTAYLAEGTRETIGLRVPADALIEGVAVLADRGRFADLDSFLRELDEISDTDLAEVVALVAARATAARWQTTRRTPAGDPPSSPAVRILGHKGAK